MDEGDIGLDGEDTIPVTGDEKLGDLLQKEWIRPDFVLEEDEGKDETTLPWEREEENRGEEEETRGLRKRKVKAPTLAELTIEDAELRRLRRMGMFVKDRISVPKAGLIQAVLDKIHDKWRKEELVRLKFHEVLATDMKTAHEIVEVFSNFISFLCAIIQIDVDFPLFLPWCFFKCAISVSLLIVC